MTISISGTVYTDEGVTTIGSGRTLNLSVNGAASSGSTTTASDGTYTISGITAAAGAVITVYIQDGTNTEKAALVTRSTGSDMSGIDLYQDYLNLRSDDGSPLTGANINTSDTNGATGISGIYSSTAASILTMVSGKSLLIMSGQTWAMASMSVILRGHFINNGTVTVSGPVGTLSFSSGLTSARVKTNGSTFATVIFNSATTTWTLQDNLTQTNGGLQLVNGTLDVSVNNYTITLNSGSSAGNWLRTSGTFIARNGTVIFDGNASTRTINGGGGAFWNLTHQNANTLALSTSNLTVSNNLTNSAGTLDSNGLDITVGGNWSNTATFAQGTRTVTLDGTAQIISGTTTFYNLVCANPGDVISFTDGTTQTVSNSVTFQNVTLQGTSTGGWTLACPATQTIDHVTVRYSTATGNTAVAGTGSVDGGNNTNWTFPTTNISSPLAVILAGQQGY